MSAKLERQLRAIERGNRNNGSVRRLVEISRRLMAEVVEMSDRLRRFEEARDGQLDRARPDPERLLLVVHEDGYVQVYGESWHCVEVIEMPRVAPANIDIAEECMLLQVPRPYRDLYYPGKVRASANVRACPSVVSLCAAHEIEELLQQLNTLKGHHQEQAA